MKYGRWTTIFALFALVIAVDLIAADLSEKEQDFLDSIESGYMKDFQNLLKKGVSPNTTDESGDSALILAIYYERPEMVKILPAFRRAGERREAGGNARFQTFSIPKGLHRR